MLAALLVATLLSPSEHCASVPECVAIAQREPAQFTPRLSVLLAEGKLPLGVLLDGWKFEASSPEVTARIHRVLLSELLREREASKSEWKRLVDFAVARARESRQPSDQFLSTVLIEAGLSPHAEVLSTCAGSDPVGRLCALWAANAGRPEKAVVDAVWKMLDADELPTFPGAEAVANCAPLRARFRERATAELAADRTLRAIDVTILVQINEPWSRRQLEAWSDNPDPAKARPVLEMLTAPSFGLVKPPAELVKHALWRCLRDEAVGLRRTALRALGEERHPPSLDPDERRELVAIAQSGREAGRRLSSVLARFAHELPEAQPIVVHTLFAPQSEDLTTTKVMPRGATYATLVDTDLSQFQAWEAVKRTPESVCWLSSSLRAWLSDDARDWNDEHARFVLRSAGEWVDARWGSRDLAKANEAAYGPSSRREFVCGTGIVEARMDAAADAKAFGLAKPGKVAGPARMPPVIDPEEARQAQAEKDLLSARVLREQLLETIAQPPKPEVACTPPPPVSQAHRTPRARDAGSAPTLDLTAAPGTKKVTIFGPDGSVLATVQATSGMFPVPLVMPHRFENWWRGPGTYRVEAEYDGAPKPAIEEFAPEATAVSCAIRLGMVPDDLSTSCVDRAPASVQVRVSATAQKIELTLTNGSGNRLVPAARSWLEGLQFRSAATNGVPVAPSLRDADRRAIEPGASRSWTFSFTQRPLAPGTWSAWVVYAVDGLDGRSFASDPASFTIAGETDGPSATHAFVAAKAGMLALRGQRIVKLGGPKPEEVLDAGVPLDVLVRDESGTKVLAAGAVALLSEDGGASFHPLAIPDDAPVVAAAFAGPSLLLFREQGPVLRLHGSKWKELPRPPGIPQRVVFADAQRGWLLDRDGRLATTSDGAATWAAMDAPTTDGRSLAVAGAQLWLASLSGLFVRSADGRWSIEAPLPCTDVAARRGVVAGACEPIFIRVPGRPSANFRLPFGAMKFADVTATGCAFTGELGTVTEDGNANTMHFAGERPIDRRRIGPSPVGLFPDEPTPTDAK